MKRNLKYIAGALTAYVIILILLTIVESGAEGATIRTIWDAIWYSVVTLTTVGYGDLSPVTGIGRVLGIVLALCSLGVLSAIISVFLRLIGEQFLPMAKLRAGRGKHWYVFNCAGRDAVTLARQLDRKDGLLVFLADESEAKGTEPGAVYTSADVRSLKDLKDGDDGITMFLMKDDPWENYCEGLEAASMKIESYCMSDMMVGDVPDGMSLFGKAECLGRWYWQYHPLVSGEKCVVLIGCGRYGAAVLERALLTNVLTPGRTAEYHVFEDEAGFRAMHTELVRALEGSDPDDDKLVFHGEKWYESVDLLRRADRIILCRDDDASNLDVYEKLSTWFAIRDSVHVRLSKKMPGVNSFGEGEKILTGEYVMKGALNKQAVLMHGIYSKGSGNPVPWEKLGYFFRQSNIAAADHLLVKIRFLLEDDTITNITPENCRAAYEVYAKTRESMGEIYQKIEHRRWMHFYLLHNWVYSEKRDNEKRRHPLLLPYEKLAPEEKRKDAYAWEMLGELYG